MSRVITGVLLVALGCHGAWDGSISSDVDQGGQPWKSFKSCRRMYFGVRTLNMTKTWNVVKEGNVECKASGDPVLKTLGDSQYSFRGTSEYLITTWNNREHKKEQINTCFAGVDHGESYVSFVKTLTYRCGKTLLYARATMDEPSFYFFNESDYTLLGGTGQFSYCMFGSNSSLICTCQGKIEVHAQFRKNYLGLPVISLFVHYPMDVAHENLGGLCQSSSYTKYKGGTSHCNYISYDKKDFQYDPCGPCSWETTTSDYPNSAPYINILAEAYSNTDIEIPPCGKFTEDVCLGTLPSPELTSQPTPEPTIPFPTPKPTKRPTWSSPVPTPAPVSTPNMPPTKEPASYPTRANQMTYGLQVPRCSNSLRIYTDPNSITNGTNWKFPLICQSGYDSYCDFNSQRSESCSVSLIEEATPAEPGYSTAYNWVSLCPVDKVIAAAPVLGGMASNIYHYSSGTEGLGIRIAAEKKIRYIDFCFTPGLEPASQS